MDQHEAAAADIAGARQGDRQREADRDRRVDRIAPQPQDVEPDSRGRRLLGDDHAVHRHDRTSRCERRNDRRRIGARDRGRKDEESEGGEAEAIQGVSLRMRRSAS